MGLDLYLVQKQKNGIERELCYGRKTWSIADYFSEYGDPVEGYEDYIWNIPFEVWKSFVNKAKGFDLEEMETLANVFADGEETIEEAEKVEDFVCKFGDEYPSLGFAHEALFILRWLNEDDEVRAAFKETPNDIYLVASY